jgi:hypothetical protein
LTPEKESARMLIQRVFTLLTGAIIALCLGVALVMLAFNPAPDSERSAPTAARPDNADQASAEPTAPADLAQQRADIEKQIGDSPEYSRFFARLKETFPGDYDTAINGFASRGANPGQQDGVDLYVSETVRQLRQSRGAIASKAEPGLLGRVFDLQLDVLRAIGKQDPKMCVAFLYGATNQDFQNFAATRRALVGEMALAGLEAIVSGQDKKIDRPAPSDADFKVLEAALVKRGLNKVEIDALLDGKTPDPPLEDARMCAAGQTYLDALRTLPEPVRLRIYGLAVELMARS